MPRPLLTPLLKIFLSRLRLQTLARRADPEADMQAVGVQSS